MAFLAALPAIASAVGGVASLARGFGPQGSGFSASGVPLMQGATPEQAKQAFTATQAGLQQQQDFVNQLHAQNALANQSNVFNQQQGLANQLGLQAQGQGPNPALAQLAQTTGANVANQAALMAGQRGAGANIGMLARQAAQQGAGIQQNAAGQAATLRAQQQLAAQQLLAQQQQAMAGLSTNQAGQLQQGVLNQNQLQQSEQQNLLNSIAQQNNAAVGQQSNINNANVGIAEQNARMGQNQMASLGSVISPVTSLLSNAFSSSPAAAPQIGAGNSGQTLRANFASGGEVEGPVSNVGKYLNAAHGAVVPGRARGGDNLKNDTVPAMLSPKEIVLPRSVTLSDDAPSKAAKFVSAIKNRSRK